MPPLPLRTLIVLVHGAELTMREVVLGQTDLEGSLLIVVPVVVIAIDRILDPAACSRDAGGATERKARQQDHDCDGA